jgi:hypothetical protein
MDRLGLATYGLLKMKTAYLLFDLLSKIGPLSSEISSWLPSLNCQ